MKKSTLLLFSLFIVTFLVAQNSLKTAPPNIVLLLVDDAALMDFGAYGGEAATPNIDKLAHEGMMFTNYHTSPMCAPSRAMLITGCDSHLTGVPNLPEFLAPEHAARPGYGGVLNDSVKTVAEHLKRNGYRTYMAGKWHLGHTENSLPSKRGFDRTFILDASGADNYEQKAYLAIQESKPPWFGDGKPTELPDDFYSSKTYVDKMISFMDGAPEKEKPFFAYLAFQAIHIPVQAPKEFVDKYRDIYKEGWDRLRQQRFEKAKHLGLISTSAKLGEMLPVLDKWDDISAEEQQMAANDMAVNAAMLEAMDFHIGRYIQYLKEKGQLENTVFIITSDNGPEPSAPPDISGANIWLKWVGYHRDSNRLGEKRYYGFIGPEFASAAAGPSAFFKLYAGEGGLRVPLVVSGKNIPIGKTHAFSFVTDVVPTILSLAGIGYDAETTAVPMTGKDLFPIIQQDSTTVYRPDEPIGMEAAGQAALFKGDLKLARNGKPYGDGVWRLYNLANDPGETNDLKETAPELFAEMMGHYMEYAEENGVVEMGVDYETLKEIQNKVIRDVMKNSPPYLMGLGVLIVGLVYRRQRKKRGR